MNPLMPRKMLKKSESMFPCGGIHEVFREDVRTHSFCMAINHYNLLFRDDVTQPRQGYAVCPVDVAEVFLKLSI